MTASDPVLQTVDVTRRFDATTAVDGVSVSFSEHGIHGIIGPNGSGKSTLLNLMAGTIDPTAGSVLFRGADITDEPVDAVARRGILKSNQQTDVFGHLTALENVAIAVSVARDGTAPVAQKGFPSETTATASAVLERCGIADQAAVTAHDLSYGQQKLLELALVIGADPDVVLLDEPTAGLSEDSITQFTSLLGTLSDETTIVLIEHDQDVVRDLTDHIVVMHEGSVIAEGPFEEIRTDEEVQRLYLGGRR